MADLNEQQSAQAVKLTGSSALGAETFYVDVDASGNLKTVVNNASGASAVNVQDGGNSLTVDSPQLPASLAQKTSANSLAVVIASDQSAVPASQSGTWNINNVSGTVSLPTGAATSANQTTEITSLQLIDDSIHAQNAALNKGIPIMGQLDDTSTIVATEDNVSVARITAQRAIHTNPRNSSGTELATASNPFRIDPTGTTTQPISAASLPLPAGASTSALQTTGNTSLGNIDTKLPTTVGQKTMAASLAVTIASDQTAVPASQSGTWNINNVSGTVSLPTGAATSALQTTGNASLASIDAGIPAALGAATIANSMPVTIASDQTVPISAAALPLPAGAATSANQTTEITSLQLLDDTVHAQNAALNKGVPLMGQFDDTSTVVATEDNVAVARITAQRSVHTNLRDGTTGTEMIGQKLMVSSIPVVLASDQILVTQTTPLPASGSKFAFGDVSTASSASTVPVERTTYTEQTTNGQRSIASASALDAAAGTGARTVQITYYDQTGAGPLTETLTLNGTTGVNTVGTNICFIESIKVLTAGSTGSNAGIITLYAAINKGGAVIGTINALDNQTFWAHHYVPLNKTCYISGFSINNNSQASGNGAYFILRAVKPTVANSVNIQISDFHHLFGSQSGTSTRTYFSPIQVVGPARVTAYVTPESNVAISQKASFDFIDN